MKDIKSKTAAIRVFIDDDIKAKAQEVLHQQGLTYSDAVRDLFVYIATTGNVPFKRESKVTIK